MLEERIEEPAASSARPSQRVRSAGTMARALAFVEREFRGGYTCRLSESVDFAESSAAPPEVFTAILVAELLGPLLPEALRDALVSEIESRRTADGWVHFFEDPRLLPADVDCTALASTALWRLGALDEASFQRTLDAIIGNTTQLGVIGVYRDLGERAEVVDPAVAVNALYAINHGGRADEARATEQWVASWIASGCSGGTRYYHCPDTFLLFASRLVHAFPERYASWLEPLQRAIRRRHEEQMGELDVAQWAAAATLVGVSPSWVHQRCDELLASQHAEGAWAAQALFKYGRKRVYFGSRVLSTAFAVYAVYGAWSLQGGAYPAHDQPVTPSAKNAMTFFMSSGLRNTWSTSGHCDTAEGLVPVISATQRSEGKRLRQTGISEVASGCCSPNQ